MKIAENLKVSPAPTHSVTLMWLFLYLSFGCILKEHFTQESKLCNYLQLLTLTSFQTHMTFFFQWKTMEEPFKNVSYIGLLFMFVDSSYILSYIIFLSTASKGVLTYHSQSQSKYYTLNGKRCLKSPVSIRPAVVMQLLGFIIYRIYQSFRQVVESHSTVSDIATWVCP